MKSEEYLNKVQYDFYGNPVESYTTGERRVFAEEYGDLRALEAVEEYKQSLISQDIYDLLDEMTIRYIVGEIITTNTNVMSKGDIKELIQIIKAKHQKQLKGMVSVDKAVNEFKSFLIWINDSAGICDISIEDHKEYVEKYKQNLIEE